KGNRRERLPLPIDVGEAVAAYIMDGRPRARGCRLFMRVRAPIGAATKSSVQRAVRQACDRVGIAWCGTHRLRHTAATEMLRSGASLPEVGQVLRHRNIATTAIYAKVDRVGLRVLARPWPGGAA
ncbi:MAG TPA: tyrosine-type recombinase/integrase, partial [Acidimicrobiales bacterium]|nr:tyrosine-type recombinase/integrase [Acidimicrobiales bacterium]